MATSNFHAQNKEGTGGNYKKKKNKPKNEIHVLIILKIILVLRCSQQHFEFPCSVKTNGYRVIIRKGQKFHFHRVISLRRDSLGICKDTGNCSSFVYFFFGHFYRFITIISIIIPGQGLLPIATFTSLSF